MKNTCSGCPTEWAGLNIAHCGACHETFSTVANFDVHRPQIGPFQGRCVDPERIEHGRGTKYAGQPVLRRDKRGFWVSSFERPEMDA